MIHYNVSLKPYNTFGIDVSANAFASFDSVESLSGLQEEKVAAKQPLLVLGGGSNLLFTKNFDGLVLKNEIMGIEKIKEDADHVWVRTGAGENWHDFVLHCMAHELAGVENLSLIPGCTGASPMQNIGAYGVEIKDVFDSLEAWHLKDKALVTFNREDCAFGYRESVFKNTFKNKFAITHVTFKLHKKPVFNTSYGAIEQELEAMGAKELSIKAISDAVIRIRQSKLPNPAVIGNAGSFFKNSTIPTAQYEKLKETYSGIPGYPVKQTADDGLQTTTYTKVAAGWLIEQCGWKGYREGDAGVHPKQALVLVNYASARGQSIYDLSSRIKDSVMNKFGIELEREVNIL